MKRVVCLLSVPAMLSLAPLVGCREHSESESHQLSGPASIEVAECAACGMVVREQPAPRAQAVHRDGTRVHFCSIGDLVHYMQAPSPHGDLTEIYVEALARDDDNLSAIGSHPRPWKKASALSYVVGVERRGVMGVPVLAYEQGDLADAVAAHHGANVVEWKSLPSAVLQAEVTNQPIPSKESKP